MVIRINQIHRRDGVWQHRSPDRDHRSQWVLVFSNTATLLDDEIWQDLRNLFPRARIVGCSTAGEIIGTEVCDDSLTCTAVEFDRTPIEVVSVRTDTGDSAEMLAKRLCAFLPQPELRHVFLLSDGLHVNGSGLLEGLIAHLPSDVQITGGFAGDGSRFGRTAVCLDGPSPSDQIIAVGLYGPNICVGHGSQGGWDPFGVERQITKSKANIVYELDGSAALDLYCRYLGNQATQLPAAGLRFPLAIRDPHQPEFKPLVRTILGIDETHRSLIFAGDVPTGYLARLMSANIERLLDGAREAAIASCQAFGTQSPQLAILISCVGRKLVLNQRVEEEVDEVRSIVGKHTPMTGFYSYGELSPFAEGPSRFHNQTMTITTLSER